MNITLYRLFYKMNLPEPSRKDISALGAKIGRLYKELSGEHAPRIYQVENGFKGYVNCYPSEFHPVMENIINSWMLEKK